MTVPPRPPLRSSRPAAEPAIRRHLERSAALRRSRPRGALGHADRALTAARELGDAALLALAHRHRAHALRAVERHDEALRDYAAARRAFLRAGDRSEAARTQIGRVDALMYLDRYAEARRVGSATLRELEALGDPVRAGRLRMNLGNLEYRRDRPDAALRLYRRAREQLAGSPALDLALVDHNIANILASLGRLDEAEPLYRAVRAAAADADHDLLRLHADYALADIAARRGDTRRALVALEDCERGFAGAGHARGRCNCLLDRAEIYRRLHLHDDAEATASDAARGFARLGLGLERARAEFVAGAADLAAGRTRRGRGRLRRAAERFAELGNPVQGAAVALRAAQMEAGRGGADDLRRARRVFLRTGYGDLAAEAALELARRTRGRVRRRWLGEAARRIPRGRPELRARWGHLRALAAAETGDARGAVRHAEDAVARLRDARRGLALDEFVGAHFLDLGDLYRDAQRLCVEGAADRPGRVFAVAARVESLADADRARGGEPPADPPAARALRRRLFRDGAPDVLAPARRERALLEDLRRERLRSPDAADTPAEPGLEELQRSLRPGDLWLQPVDEGSHLALLVADRSGARVLPRAVRAADLGEVLDDLAYQAERIRVNRAFAERRRASLAAAADRAVVRLGDLVVRPWADHGPPDRLLVRAGGGLDAVPWHALGDPALVGSTRVVVVPGASWFLAAGTRPPRAGFPRGASFWGAGGEALPLADEEARSLAAGVEGAACRAGADATRARFLREAPRAGLLHFAGHGAFRADNPLFSLLRFADEDLWFADLETLRLRAELVVLSACRTGRSGNELDLGTGFSRGFLRAGARALVAGHWLLEDRAALVFMGRFYRALAEVPPAEALRRAAEAGRAAGDPLADWAPFFLVGAG